MNKKNENHDTIVSLKDSLTTELDSILECGNINGFGVAVVNQDTTLYIKSFGYSDAKEKKLYTQNTLQNIGSVSKK